MTISNLDLATVSSELEQLARRIGGLVVNVRETLAVNDASQWRVLALLRFEMLQALSKFIVYKDGQILAPVIFSGDPASVKQASQLMARNGDLQNEYEAFVARWALTSPLSVDTVYKAEAAEMMAPIERQVADDIEVLRILISEVTLDSHSEPPL